MPHFLGQTPSTIPNMTSPSLSHYFLVRPEPTHGATLLRPPVVASLPSAASPHLRPSSALTHHRQRRPTPVPLLGMMKATALVGSLGDLPMHVARQPLVTVATVGQVPLGLVRSLLDLPRPRSNLVYSSRHPSAPHRTATITAIFFFGGSPEQTTLPPCWVTRVTPTSSPHYVCQEHSFLLPSCLTVSSKTLPLAMCGFANGHRRPSPAFVGFCMSSCIETNPHGLVEP